MHTYTYVHTYTGRGNQTETSHDGNAATKNTSVGTFVDQLMGLCLVIDEAEQ